jgi:hypothetical protein
MRGNGVTSTKGAAARELDGILSHGRELAISVATALISRISR